MSHDRFPLTINPIISGYACVLQASTSMAHKTHCTQKTTWTEATELYLCHIKRNKYTNAYHINVSKFFIHKQSTAY